MVNKSMYVALPLLFVFLLSGFYSSRVADPVPSCYYIRLNSASDYNRADITLGQPGFGFAFNQIIVQVEDPDFHLIAHNGGSTFTYSYPNLLYDWGASHFAGASFNFTYTSSAYPVAITHIWISNGSLTVECTTEIPTPPPPSWACSYVRVDIQNSNSQAEFVINANSPYNSVFIEVNDPNFVYVSSDPINPWDPSIGGYGGGYMNWYLPDLELGGTYTINYISNNYLTAFPHVWIGNDQTFFGQAIECLPSGVTPTPTPNDTPTPTIAPFNFNGFFQPIDNLPTLNTMKAGQGVPLKFSLRGDHGLNIIATGYPTSSIVACGLTAEDAIEQTMTAGSSSLTYNASTDQYIYIWKTDKMWAGTCRTLVIKLSDGTFHRANFKFK